MRVRFGLLVCLGIVGLVVFGTIAPRFRHPFPSMIDDWNAIATFPARVRTYKLSAGTSDARPALSTTNAGASAPLP